MGVGGGRGVGNGLVGDPCKHILVSAMEETLEKVLVGEEVNLTYF